MWFSLFSYIYNFTFLAFLSAVVYCVSCMWSAIGGRYYCFKIILIIKASLAFFSLLAAFYSKLLLRQPNVLLLNEFHKLLALFSCSNCAFAFGFFSPHFLNFFSFFFFDSSTLYLLAIFSLNFLFVISIMTFSTRAFAVLFYIRFYSSCSRSLG